MSDYKNGDTASWDASQVRRSQAGHTGRSQGNPSQQPQRRRRKRRRINPVLYILCVLVASAILAGVGWLLASDLCAFSRDIPSTTKITIEITADDDMGSIAEKLQDAGLIRYKWFFRLFAAVTGASEEVGIGTYELNTDMDYHALIAGMRSSSGNLSAETVTVTIPEGYTVRQTIALLHDDRLFKQMLHDGLLTVLAINTENTPETAPRPEAAPRAGNRLPTDWMAGTASHTLTDNELYILPSMPTLYLLDKEKHVLLKEALPEQVLSHLAKESRNQSLHGE